MPTPETRSHVRYNWLKNFLRERVICQVKDYEAVMMDEFGVLPRTTAQYVKSMETLGFITFNKDRSEVNWIVKK
jgi:hypothetical protein